MMKAIKTVEGHKAELQTIPIPQLRDEYILVKTKTVALNPTDWKHIDIAAPPGTTIGCDFAGIVEEIGAEVPKSYQKGDRISGFTHGGNGVQPEDGCAAEYCVVKMGLCMKIPDSISDEAACTFGVAITTIGQGLYQALDLPLPNFTTKAQFSILIYGGSTATGSLAIQFARLSGCTNVVTTCSARNFSFVKDRGAHAAYDYTDPECVEKIKECTGGALAHAFDCISTPASAAICSKAIGSTGGVVSYLLPIKHEREDVQAKYTLAYTALGEYFKVGGKDFEARRQDLSFATIFWERSARLIENGQLKAHPQDIGDGGLEGIFGGLQSMREGKVSGKKLVYRVGNA